MAKGAYVGVGGVAHKVKKIYTGVDNVAKQVKKGYVGVGGVARPFFSAEAELQYYGAIDPLAIARQTLAATTVGNYAIFAGGAADGGGKNAMDYYTNSLVKGTGKLRDARSDLAATTVGNYAIFAGGEIYPPDAKGWYTSYSVDTYDSSLTRRTGTALSQRRGSLAATTVGNYALFGGGGTVDTVDAYNTAVVRTTPTALSEARGDLAATTVGDYALFGGGHGDSSGLVKATVDAYNSVLTRTTPSALNVARAELAAATVGDYALFGGGYGDDPFNKFNVDAYNSSLSRTTPSTLNAARYNLAATTVGNYALFGGGYQSPNIYLNTVDVYDDSLTKNMASNLSKTRQMLAATTVGDYALFGGGNGTSPVYKDTVDAYYQEDAQYVDLTIEFLNKAYGTDIEYTIGTQISLYEVDGSSPVDNKYAIVSADDTGFVYPPLNVRIKKGILYEIYDELPGITTINKSNFKTDLIPSNDSGSLTFDYFNSWFSLNPKFPNKSITIQLAITKEKSYPVDPP